MSTAAELEEVLRRRSIGQQASVAADASMASMAIKAAGRKPDQHLGKRAIRAVQVMLELIDQLSRYRDDGYLQMLVSNEHVARDPSRSAQVMARAAHQRSQSPNAVVFPALDVLIENRSSVEARPDEGSIKVMHKKHADELADALENFANRVVSDASREDHQGRTSQFAVA